MRGSSLRSLLRDHSSHDHTTTRYRRHLMKKGFVLALCLAAACSKSGDKPADSTQAAAAGGSKKLTLAMIGKSSNNPVFLAARTGADAAAKELSAKENMTIEVAWLTPPQEDGE